MALQTMIDHEDQADGLEEDVRILLEIIYRYTAWEPARGVEPKQPPVHGPCCTCQDCGRTHDSCLCEHNEIAARMEELQQFDLHNWKMDFLQHLKKS